MTQDESDAAYQQSVLHHNAPATAQKLRRLIAAAECVVARLEVYYDDTDRVRFERDRLREAVREARKP